MTLFSKSNKLFHKHSSGFCFWKLDFSRSNQISNKDKSFSFWSCWFSSDNIHSGVFLQKFFHSKLISDSFYIDFMIIHVMYIWIFLMIELKGTYSRWEIHLTCKSINNINHFMLMFSPYWSCHKSCIVCGFRFRNCEIYSCGKLMRMCRSRILKGFFVTIRIPMNNRRSSLG